MAIAVGLALLAAGCSGSASTPTGEPSTNPELGLDTTGPFNAIEVVDSLVQLAGDDQVAPSLALLIAADRGYRPGTVAAAILGGRFTLDGIAVDAAGNDVLPAGTDTGFIENKRPLDVPGEESLSGGEVILVGFKQASGVTVEDLGRELLDDFERVDLGAGPGRVPPPEDRPDVWQEMAEQDAKKRLQALSILHLLRRGFSPEQVVEAIVFGRRPVCDWRIIVGVHQDRDVDGQCTLDGEEPDLSPSDAYDFGTDAAANTESDSGESAEPEPAPSGSTIESIADGVYEGSVDTSGFNPDVTGNFETRFTFTKDGHSYDFFAVISFDRTDLNVQLEEIWASADLISLADNTIILDLTIIRGDSETDTTIGFDLIGNELVMQDPGSGSLFRVSVDFEKDT